jgi:Hypothetical glycosyl hydrolase family 15
VGAAVVRRIVAASVLAAALTGVTIARSAHASGSAPVPNTGALRICSNCPQTGGDLARYGYVILNSWDAPLIPALKASNPNLKVLLYKNLSFSMDYACSNGVDSAKLPSGVGYCDANANHPGWFLQDTAGGRINSAQYPSAWLMDVGNADYQSRWLANVQAEVKAEGWDGVFADDTNADMGWHLNGRTIARYPSTAAWQAATRSMLARVGPALTTQGTLFVPNLYAPWLPDYDAQALWKDWIQFTSGAAQEYYSKWGSASSGWFTGSDWTFRQQFQLITEQAGKIFLGLTYAPRSDTRSMVYARSNFLLNTTGGRSALVFEPGDQEASDPYSPSWTVDIGAPSGSRYQVGGAWRRDFTGGTVVVNPSNAAVTVPLGSGYVDGSGAAVSSVTLAPASGAILLDSGTGTSAPPPPPTVPLPPGQPPISLTATQTHSSVQLNWRGPKSRNVDVSRNGVAIRRTPNDGSYTDRLGSLAAGTFAYKVCLAGTSTCSGTVSLLLTPGASSGRMLAVTRPTASHTARGHRARRAIRSRRARRTLHSLRHA